MSRRHPLRPIGKPRGRPFVRGRSGNPGGRPADPTKSRGRPERYDADVRKLAREHGPDAIKKLKDIMDNASAPFSAQIMAANSLLDRGFGRPAAMVGIAASLDVPATKVNPLELIKARLAAIHERLQAEGEISCGATFTDSRFVSE